MIDGLFPEPERVLHELSKMYDIGHYNVRKGRSAKWLTYTPRAWCDECFALQHEHRDDALQRVRAQAVVRRTIPGGSDLVLCYPHSQLWRERDADRIEKS